MVLRSGFGMVVFCRYTSSTMGEGLVVGGVTILLSWHIYPDVGTASGELLFSAPVACGGGR